MSYIPPPKTTMSSDEVPSGIVHDNSYAIPDPSGPSEHQGTGPGGPNSAGSSAIPVVTDDTPIRDPINPATANSDAQLEQDEKEAIDKRNILPKPKTGGRVTRQAGQGGRKEEGAYREPGDEEGMPGPEDGSSNLRTGRVELVP